MRVVGLDVCKNSVVACILDSACRREPRLLYYDLDFPRLYTNAQGIKTLLSMNVDVAVLEPTGVNYSKLWATHLAVAGVKVVMVGHKQLRAYRINLDLPDKDDQADALALACYYLEHRNNFRRFVRERDPVVAKIRDCVLRLNHLNRLMSPTINRVHQDLAWQFPEVAAITLDARLFWGWLSGEKRSQKYDNLYRSTIGLGLNQEVRNGAKLICDLQQRAILLELEMRSHMKDPRFIEYRAVFSNFGFGERVEALILSQIYPLANYLDESGKPEIRIRKGKVSGLDTKRHLSRRRFQKALGVAPQREESGDVKSSKKAGSSLVRQALWLWLFTRIEPKRSRLKNPTGQFLGELLDKEKQYRPTKLARARVCSKAVDLLFQELVKKLCT